MAGCASGPQTQALAPAGFDRVTVGGELRQRIERNFDRLETDYYQPDQVYWTEEQSADGPATRKAARFWPSYSTLRLRAARRSISTN